MNPTFFETPAKWRAWLKANHAKADELLVGFHKRHTGTASITYQEALDEALCFGWIDGRRTSLSGTAYTIRFTPRRKGSIWSAINIKRVAELAEQKRMAPAGTKAFAERDPTKAKRYSYENRDRTLDAESQAQLKANAKAWTFWEAQPPSYRRPASWWIISAVKPETRARRLKQLIADCANGVRVKHLIPRKGKK